MALLGNPFATTASGQPLPPQGQQQAGNIQQNQQFSQQQTGSGIVPDQNNQQGQQTQQNQQQQKSEGNPLEDFSKLWDTDDSQENQQNQNAGPETYLPAVDPAKLTEMVNRIDFTKSATPEQRAAIAAGGEPAVQAMMDIVNSATRSAFMMGFQGTQKMVESGLGSAKTKFLSEVPNHVKDVMALDGLTSSNPIMSDPAFAKVVNDVRGQLQAKHPKATPSQIEGAVNKYFDDMVTKMQKAKTDGTQQNQTEVNQNKIRTGDADADWSTWIEGAVQQNSLQ